MGEPMEIWEQASRISPYQVTHKVMEAAKPAHSYALPAAFHVLNHQRQRDGRTLQSRQHGSQRRRFSGPQSWSLTSGKPLCTRLKRSDAEAVKYFKWD
jgi:hypothetical protein